MKAWIGCLGCYNNGRLEGKWLDADGARDLVAAGLAQRATYENGHTYAACIKCCGDEFAILDFDDVPRVLAYEIGDNIAVFSEWAEEWERVADQVGAEVLEAYAENVAGEVETALERVEEAFAGEFASEEDWAEDYLDGTGSLASVPAELRLYIDYEKYARDARMGGDVDFVDTSTGVLAFWANV